MADPPSWKLLQAMETRLQTISVANGYHTDAGATVTLEPAPEWEEGRDYYVAPVLDTVGRSASPARRPRDARAATVAVLAMVKVSRADAQSLLHKLLFDLDKAFPSEQPAMAQVQGGTRYPRYLSTEVLPRKEGSKWIGALVRFESDYLI
jgi:hypothetical protein